jgi:hypothetical protein
MPYINVKDRFDSKLQHNHTTYINIEHKNSLHQTNITKMRQKSQCIIKNLNNYQKPSNSILRKDVK